MPILIISLGILFLIRGIVKYILLVKQVDRLNKILYLDKEPNKYISELDKLLNKKFKSKRDRDINLLQKATGLFYAGRFEESCDVLNNKLDKIPANGQNIYYQNLILSLIFNGKIKEGHQLLLDNTEVLETSKRGSEANKSGVEFIFAVDDLYQGKFNETKEFFINQCENGRNDYKRSMAYYLLGVIYKNEHNFEEMNTCFEKSKKLGKNLFVNKLINEEENI